MGIEDTTSSNRQRWKTGRERNRLKARFDIKSRIASHVTSSTTTPASHGLIYVGEKTNGESGRTITHGAVSTQISSSLSLQDARIIVKYLRAVIKNVISAFSLAALSLHGNLLNGPLPIPTYLKPEKDDNDESRSEVSTEKSCSNPNAFSSIDLSEEEQVIHSLSMLLSTTISWDHQPYQELQQQIDNQLHSLNDQSEQLKNSKCQQPKRQEQSSSLSNIPLRPRQHEQHQPSQLANSKYGSAYVMKRLIPYMKAIQQTQKRHLTLMEYASLLGRHGIVGSLLTGGLDPSNTNNGRTHHYSGSEIASKQILALFHSLPSGGSGSGSNVDEKTSPIVPISIWCYMIRSVIEMRMNCVLNADDSVEDGTINAKQCPMCHHCEDKESPSRFLNFGPNCHHSFCEPCMWQHLVVHVTQCCIYVKSNVVTCPLCSAEFQGFQYCNDGDCNYMKQVLVKHDKMDEHRTRLIDKSLAMEGDLNKTNFFMNNLSLCELRHESEGGDDTVDNSSLLQSSNRQKQHHRQQRCLESLVKFMKLPATTTDLKKIAIAKNKRPKRSKKEKDPIHSTWADALRPLVQGHQSQDVRTDRFFKAVISSPARVMAYLDAGIDVNMKNIYGQTPLYLACWKGSVIVVEWLLEYGANFKINANGGSTCWGVAKSYGRVDVMELLERYENVASLYQHSQKESTSVPYGIDSTSSTSSEKGGYQVEILIDPSMDHPGAGACIVDNALSETQLRRLESLWQSLPLGDSCYTDGEDAKQQQTDGRTDSTTVSEKSLYRPSRSYFCDAEQEIQFMLKGCVTAARNALELLNHQKVKNSSALPSTLSSRPHPTTAETTDGNRTAPPTSLFQHIRFLHYDRSGGVLPAHVDLCRVDETSGRRSTHTFILYMNDCEHGGGTALLKHLADPEVLAIIQPRKGRALIFPHMCPHSGLQVESLPKLLLRGEVVIDMTLE